MLVGRFMGWCMFLVLISCGVCVLKEGVCVVF